MFLVLILFRAWDDPAYFQGVLGWLPLALIPGLLYGISFHAYVNALKIGEVSLLTPLFASGFVLMYVYDVIGGWAELSVVPLSGVLMVTLGIALLNPAPVSEATAAGAAVAVNGGMRGTLAEAARRLDPRVLLRQPGAWGMITCAVAVATGRAVDKHLSADAEPLIYAVVVNTPPVLIGLAILAAQRRLPELTRLARDRTPLVAISAVIGHGAFLMYVYCLHYFPPSVIEPVSQLGVFIAVGLGGLWFKEPVRARWLPSAMVVAGAAILLV
jgi:drug/metabolite transporter (DMT)-like permease